MSTDQTARDWERASWRAAGREARVALQRQGKRKGYFVHGPAKPWLVSLSGAPRSPRRHARHSKRHRRNRLTLKSDG